MALVVTGRVRHRQLKPARVQEAVRKRLPGVLVDNLDFSVELKSCSVQFFCSASTFLDFTVTHKAGGGPAPAHVTDLARETAGLNEVLLKALGGRLRRAKVDFCMIEDERSRSGLLRWTSERPLLSRPAKLSYVLCLGLLALAAVLVHNALHQASGSARTNDIVSILLATCVPALLLPLSFVFEHLKVRSSGKWVFSQAGENSS